MPFTERGDAKIYWEEHGTGEPLLLIMGLGSASALWARLLPSLAAHYRVVIFDNRGVGQTVAAPASISIPAMADDAAAVLDAAGIETAHVLGYSMGGFIAQEFALEYPARLRSLILAATACGGREAILAAPEVLGALAARGGDATPEAAFRAVVPFMYDAATARELIEEDVAARVIHAPTRENYMAQLQAIITWQGAHDRLTQISAPTLVLHGATDQLIPPANGEILALAIPQAKLVMLPATSHIFTTDNTQIAADKILEFLNAQSA